MMTTALAALLAAVVLAGCQTARVGARCRTTDFGQDARNVLVCRNGRWQALMTKQRAAEVVSALRPVATAPPTAVATPPPTTPATSAPTAAPVGFFAVRGVPGHVTITGTFDDPDTPTVAVHVRVRVDGTVVRTLVADQPNVLPAGGTSSTTYNLLDVAVPVAPGARQVCVEGANTQAGPDLVRCSTLTIGTPLTGVTSASRTRVTSRVGCVVLGDTTVRCRGDNTFGAVGNGTWNVLVEDPATVLRAEGGPLTGAAAVATGPFNTCALMIDTTVRCWGSNEHGTVGDGTTSDRLVATTVTGAGGAPLTGATSLTVGFHACAVLADSTVRCWGYNSFGGLGDGSTSVRTRAVTVALPGGSPLNGVTQVDAVDGSTCARRSDGTAWCWGLDETRDAYEQVVRPRVVENGQGQALTGVAQIQSEGAGTFCARRADGGVVCVAIRHLPDEGASPGPAPTPQPVMDGPAPLAGATDLLGRCIRRAGLPMRCWNEFLGTVTDHWPLPLGAGTIVQRVGDSFYGSCFLADTGLVWCGRPDGSFGPLAA